MTKPEFLRGYLVLTTQPWGRTYRTMSMPLDGEPSPAEIQIEFYFQQLQHSEAGAWSVTCEKFAVSDHWPSVEELKLSLKHYRPIRVALPAPEPQYMSMHEALDGFPDAMEQLKKMMKP